uniref:tetratricopeptide repeat protein n=1 Tax=Fodinibius sp. TaxID=1872440 RepID=UPI0035687D34
NVNPLLYQAMIKKSHILSFSLLVLLYFSVGIWKYISQGELQKDHSIKEEQNAEVKASKEFWSHYQQATTSRTAGDYEQAIHHYKEALKRDGEHMDALYYLGSMYLFQREFKEAEKYWLQLEDIQANTPRTQLQLGKLYSCMDDENPLFDLDRAEKKYRYAKDLNREEIGAPLQLSKIAILDNNMLEAGKLLDAVLSADNTNYQALFLRGYIDWIENKKEAGKKKLRKAWRIYQSLGQIQLHGEGATKKGARAMLSEDLFCDIYRKTIDSLMMQGINEFNYETFDNQLDVSEN